MCDTLVRRVALRPQRKVWMSWWTGDQGETSQCVGYSFYGLLRAKPNVQHEPTPADIYHAAQKLDAWDGEDYEGTSVRAGAKALKAAGSLKKYVWAFEIEHMIDWLANVGPCVLGIEWTSQMMNPDQDGIIKTGGAIKGGHAILALGYDDRRHMLLLKNSWGRNWGINGRCWIHYEDIDALIRQDGEACAPTEYWLL
jgi:C1A family cysteine protease